MSNFDEDFFKELLKEERDECLRGPCGIDLELHEAFVESCQRWLDAGEALDAAREEVGSCRDKSDGSFEAAAEMRDVWKQSLSEASEGCIATAGPILSNLKLVEDDSDLEMSLLRTAVMTRQTCKGLAKFAAESDLHGQLIETLLNSKKLMKEMLVAGGARDHNYGQAMKLYTQIVAKLSANRDYDSRYSKLHKRLSMAVALEFCASQVKYEFDTSTPVNPIQRAEHYAAAHAKGELDPSFASLTTYEMRMVVGSDAPNEQLQWARNTLFNFCPHICSIYDEKWRYNYIVTTDVGYKSPKWTSSPRTYDQILSGGGREGPRAWFGRMVCQAFGIPIWGVRQNAGKHVCMTRWTPEGWKLCFGNPQNDWDSATFEGRSGNDFLEEANARVKVPESEYYEKVVLLTCLSDACKEEKPSKSKSRSASPKRPGAVAADTDSDQQAHPDKVWRSLAFVQRKMFARLETDPVPRKHSIVVGSKIQRLIKELDAGHPALPLEAGDPDGVISIPAASFTSSSGKKNVKAHPCSDSDGTQLHLVNGTAEVTYYLPKDCDVGGSYELQALVCTVHADQVDLQIEVDGDVVHALEIPYTNGDWDYTAKIRVDLDPMSTLRCFRKPTSRQHCFGLAIKSFTLTPV